MSRLTERHYVETEGYYVETEGYYLKCSEAPNCPNNCEECSRLDDAINRLGEYENTGLTPGEVHSLFGEWNAMMSALNSIGGGYERLRELAEADKAGRVFITGILPTDEQAKINWFELFLNRMRDYSDGDVWGNGDELMCKTEAIADAMCDLLFQLYAAQDEEVEFHTGYYDPAEDARSGEEDRCTGWWYVDCD